MSGRFLRISKPRSKRNTKMHFEGFIPTFNHVTGNALPAVEMLKVPTSHLSVETRPKSLSRVNK